MNTIELDQLKSRVSNHWAAHIDRLLETGEYDVRVGNPPEEYDESDSSVCWGWLASSDYGKEASTIVFTFAHGERGNEPYDEDNNGLIIWSRTMSEAVDLIMARRICKAFMNKKIGFGTFKREIEKILK